MLLAGCLLGSCTNHFLQPLAYAKIVAWLGRSDCGILLYISHSSFLAITLLTYPEGLSIIFGTDLAFLQAYIILIKAAFPEALATLIITAIILIALPKKYRRPLW